jgi:hypothetical protein
METPTSSVQKIEYSADFGASNIEYRQGKYWLVGGEGDACWSITNHALFDPTTKKAEHIFTSTVGCFEGEELIDFDSQKRMIVANHRDLDASSSAQTQVYTYVKAIPIDSPNTSEYLLSEENMPTNIYDLGFASESGKLALVGKAVYLLDIESRQLEKIIDLPDDFKNSYIRKWTNENLCISSWDKEYPSDQDRTLLLNTEKLMISQDALLCKEEMSEENITTANEERRNQEIAELIANLDLPEKYTVGIETE